MEPTEEVEESGAGVGEFIVVTIQIRGETRDLFLPDEVQMVIALTKGFEDKGCVAVTDLDGDLTYIDMSAVDMLVVRKVYGLNGSSAMAYHQVRDMWTKQSADAERAMEMFKPVASKPKKTSNETRVTPKGTKH